MKFDPGGGRERAGETVNCTKQEILSAEQVAGWRLVSEAVHAKGSRIFVQRWHVGRMSHPDFHDGESPVARSAVPSEGQIWRINPATGKRLAGVSNAAPIP